MPYPLTYKAPDLENFDWDRNEITRDCREEAAYWLRSWVYGKHTRRLIISARTNTELSYISAPQSLALALAEVLPRISSDIVYEIRTIDHLTHSGGNVIVDMRRNHDVSDDAFGFAAWWVATFVRASVLTNDIRNARALIAESQPYGQMWTSKTVKDGTLRVFDLFAAGDYTADIFGIGNGMSAGLIKGYNRGIAAQPKQTLTTEASYIAYKNTVV